MRRLPEMARVTVIVLVLGMFVAGVLHAAEPLPPTGDGKPAQASAKTEPSEEEFFASLGTRPDTAKGTEKNEEPVYVTALSFIFRLALVLALAYGTIFALKRFTNIRGGTIAGQRNIRVVENSMLAANRALHLVEVGNRKYLVASTPGQISLIAELSEEDLPEVKAEDAPAGFKEQFAMFLSGKVDTSGTAKSVAQMLRESTAFFHNKVVDVARMRGKFKDV